MKLNVGCIDSFFRIFIGVWLLAAALYGMIGAWGYIGALPIITGLARVCPAYSIFGLSTGACASKESGH